jgi:hypothetical protein
VLSAMNEPEAVLLYKSGGERVIPAETMRLATWSGLAAQAAADPTKEILMPPKPEMSLSEMLNWLTTTPAWKAGTAGRGGGKDLAFHTVVQEYQRVGKALFLELEPDIGARHIQTGIQHQLQRVPESMNKPFMRQQLEQAYVTSRPGTQKMLGIEPLPVGAQ